MNKRQTGTDKEIEAARFLKDKGLTILEHSYRNRQGEIDLIAKDKDYTVFVEVKYRKTAAKGHPEEAVSYSKARKISKVADHYRIYKKMSEDANIRFDVVAIEGSDIRWYRNAFPYTP